MCSEVYYYVYSMHALFILIPVSILACIHVRTHTRTHTPSLALLDGSYGVDYAHGMDLSFLGAHTTMTYNYDRHVCYM